MVEVEKGEGGQTRKAIEEPSDLLPVDTNNRESMTGYVQRALQEVRDMRVQLAAEDVPRKREHLKAMIETELLNVDILREALRSLEARRQWRGILWATIFAAVAAAASAVATLAPLLRGPLGK